MPSARSLLESEPSFGLNVWEGSVSQMDLPHSHADIEVNYLRSGRLTYLHGGTWVELAAGQWNAFWAGLPHVLVASSPEARLHWITIPLEDAMQWNLPGGLLGDLLLGRMVRETEPTAAQSRLDGIQLRQWEADLSPGASEQARRQARREIAARLHRLAWQWASGRETVATAPAAPRAARRIFAYVSAHYTELESVEEMARAVGLHPKYLMQTFKRTYGLGLWNYVQRMRVAHAQRLLLTTDLPVTEVALDSGFGTLSAFYRAFGMFTGGFKPSQFRRLKRG